MEYNHYQVLGVPRHATIDGIKKAYKQLAKKYHPDVNPGNKFYEEHFKKINAAYALLSDPVKRQQYDVKLYYAERPAQTRPTPRPAATTRPANNPRPASAPRKPSAPVLQWNIPPKQTLIMLGVFVGFVILGFTLYRVMNRLASNNHFEMGLECEQKKEYAGAMYYYRQGIEMDNSNYKNHEHLANVLVNSRSEFNESYLEASFLYLTVLQHKEGVQDTLWYNLSQCYIQLDDYDKALFSLDHVSPEFNDTILLLKGEAFLYNKNWKQAQSMYDSFLKKHPYSDLCFQKIGYIHYKNVEYEQAKQYLDKAILINPGNGAHYYIRGLVEIADNDSSEACTDFTVSYSLHHKPAERAIYKFCEGRSQEDDSTSLSFN